MAHHPDKIKVLLVEDDALFRMGLGLVVRNSPNFELVAEVEDGESALQAVPVYRPDIVLLDIGLPGIGGEQTLVRLKRGHPEVKVLVLTSREEAHTAQAMIRSGADGYCLKGIAPDHLLRVMEEVSAGHGWFDSKIVSHLREALTARPTSQPAATLTEREREVLERIAQGASNPQIGVQLHISEGTVRVHVHAILRKLGATDRTQAVKLAMDQGLIH